MSEHLKEMEKRIPSHLVDYKMNVLSSYERKYMRNSGLSAIVCLKYFSGICKSMQQMVTTKQHYKIECEKQQEKDLKETENGDVNCELLELKG